MQREVKSLEEKGVFEQISHLPAGHHVITLMWVYDFKHGPAGEILSEKARVMILENQQGFLRWAKHTQQLLSPPVFV